MVGSLKEQVHSHKRKKYLSWETLMGEKSQKKFQKGHLIVGGCMSASHVQIPFKYERSISQNSVVLTCAC